MKTLFGIILAILTPILIIGGGLLVMQYSTPRSPNVSGTPMSTTSQAPAPIPVSVDAYKNATYRINGRQILLSNGKSETAIAASSSEKIVTTYFGNVATGDLNADGGPDAAFILTQNTGGSGTFYYVVAALQTSHGYQGTNGILLGDRIAPQATTISNGVVTVAYADRKPTDPMTAAPSLGVSRSFMIQKNALVELSSSGK